MLKQSNKIGKINAPDECCLRFLQHHTQKSEPKKQIHESFGLTDARVDNFCPTRQNYMRATRTN